MPTIAELGELLELRGVLRALLRQLGARVSRQPNDPPPVRLACLARWMLGVDGCAVVMRDTQSRAVKQNMQLSAACWCPRVPVATCRSQAAGEVVPLVAQLVELERSVFHSRDVLEGA